MEDSSQSIPLSAWREVYERAPTVIVASVASWDESSARMEALLDEIAQLYGARAPVLRVDVERDRALANALRIQAVPTLRVYARGVVVCEVTGYLPFSVMHERIRDFLPE
ncbi:thioredoxin family protein [Ferroacidibacillus organovorans]|uniref:thioredoxin family protein n=1 Tax=Ferroacidibacillus organovorans TaxID=1765683 RepID=UPI00082AD69C|nr:thioredoxin family protein [Ferroacidibacillus organovorans]